MHGQAKPKNTHIFARVAHDFYVEPRWCSEALFRVEPFQGPIHDPAVGLGRIVESAIKASYLASGSDIAEYSPMRDFAFDYLNDNTPLAYPNIVCNPPYRRARDFIERALREARKSAFLLQYCLVKSAHAGSRQRLCGKSGLSARGLRCHRAS
jgi:hypothetical protein